MRLGGQTFRHLTAPLRLVRFASSLRASACGSGLANPVEARWFPLSGRRGKA